MNIPGLEDPLDSTGQTDTEGNLNNCHWFLKPSQKLYENHKFF